MSNPTTVSSSQPSSLQTGGTPMTSAPEPATSGNESQDSIVSEAADVAHQAKDEAVEKALAAKERAAQQGREYAAASKNQAADQINVFGSAIRAAADTLEQEGQESVACYTEACADEIDRAARYVREKDFKQLYQDSSRVARRRPEVFLGGMFLAGLAISRFLKASQSGVEEDQDSGEYSSQGNFQSDALRTSTGPAAGGREGEHSDDPTRPYAASSSIRPR